MTGCWSSPAVTRMTDEIKSQIQMLSNVIGMRQKEIARRLNISVHLVRKSQRESGLVPRYSTEQLSPQMQAQILKFLKKHGAPTIARQLGIPMHKIYEVARANKFKRRKGSCGFRYRFSKEERRAISRELRAGEQAIAAKHGTSRAWVAQFRHKMWRPDGK